MYKNVRIEIEKNYDLNFRFLWLTVYKIRPHSTKPQALVSGSFNWGGPLWLSSILFMVTMVPSVKGHKEIDH
jgi:RsiW-degrading membrane proteinase PrsW (M82 family)